MLCFILYYVVSFDLQIAYRKVRNLPIGVNKLVGKVPINLLHHAKFIMSHKVSPCVISLIINAPSKIDLTSVFVVALLFYFCCLIVSAHYC